MPAKGDGPIPARIMLVGETWGEREAELGKPFVGASGFELDRMLHEAGIMRSECYVTNLINARPPGNDIGAWIALKKKDVTAAHILLQDRMVLPQVAAGYEQLLAEIALVQPNVIVALGNWAMWALTGLTGIRNWRGSILQAKVGEPPAKVIPTIHPAAVLREWSWRAPAVNDLRRAARHLQSREIIPPDWQFILRPTIQQVIDVLDMLDTRLAGGPCWLDLDLETSSRHIACCGISWSRTEALCIPFITQGNKEGYWSVEEETFIISRLRRILCHPSVQVRWQNGLYDAQYIAADWLFVPRGAQDTMISHHAVFSSSPKSLAYQASIYADHYVFWKDEGKQLAKGGTEDQHWRYNCLDCIYTREVGEVELETVEKMQLGKVHEFQQAMFWPVLFAMLRGVRVIKENRDKLAGEVQEQIELHQSLLYQILGHQVNTDSSLQMQKLFYEDLGQKEIRSRATKGKPSHVTCDDEALQLIARREPLLKPIVNCIADTRTLERFLGNFILAKLDADSRMRCSYNIGGSESGKSAPKTYRLSSSKSAFGSGTNLQTIPSEKSKSVNKAKERGHIALLGDPYSLPNVRELFGPDFGMTFFDMDLDRADLQVVVWEADDEMLKAALRQGVDIHLLNAYIISGKNPPPMEELVETHDKYAEHRYPLKAAREFAKTFCHGTNYLGKARTMAAHTGRLVHEIERAQKIWFGAHPGIKKWHERTIEQVRRHRFVENKFGYRWYIFDRIDDMIMPEAVAWVPQSTVSIVINRIWMALFLDKPEGEWDLSPDSLWKRFHEKRELEVLLQVHDSLAGEFPTRLKSTILPRMKELSRIVIPYDDPLTIPTGISTSEISWGAC